MNISKAAFLPLFALLATTAIGQGTNSFESGFTGWTVSPGANASIATAAVGEGNFPTQGNQYAVLTSDGFGDAVPGYGPHPTGAAPFGPDGNAGTGDGFVSKISRVVNRPAGENCNVSIDWTFFHDEVDDAPTFNDFLSIDVIDVATGTLIANLVFVDTGTLAGTPAYTNISGASAGDPVYVTPATAVNGESFEVAPAGFKRANVNIGSVTAPGQQLRIEVSVGNTSDTSVDCRVLVDNLRISGDGDNFRVGLRVLGSRHQDGVNNSFADGNDDYGENRFRRRAVPNEPLVIRAAGPFGSGGNGWALLAGTPSNAAPDFGFGGFSLVIPTVSAVFDGLNPTSATDAILGTLADGPNYIQANAPSAVNPGVIGLQAVMADPSNGPLFITASAMTEIEFAAEPQIPVGDTDVLDAGGNLLSLDDFGAIDLSSIGGFEFYGTNYSECFVGSNGYITFDNGDTDFTESVAEFTSEDPRIAVLWDDFDRSVGGDIRSSISPNGVVTVSWTDLVECCAGADITATNMSVQLFPDGTITCYYGSLTSISGLAGISPGNIVAGPMPPIGTLGVGPGPVPMGAGVNFSSRSSFQSGGRTPVAPGNAIWQVFREESVFSSSEGIDYNDLITMGLDGAPARITYVPDGMGGYTVFTGTN